MLLTKDIASLRYFYESLGFTQKLSYVREGTLGWLSMQFQGTTIMLQLSENFPSDRSANDIELYFVCDEVDGIYETWRRRSVAVTTPKTSFYGFEQMYVRDPDGRRVCFESEVKK